MSTLLRDVIDIPERVGADDYVLRLTDSTGDDAHLARHPRRVRRHRSLSGELPCRARPGGRRSRSTDTSRAAYLTGSFGSGKSHFMAVLYALLGNHPAVRAAASSRPSPAATTGSSPTGRSCG